MAHCCGLEHIYRILFFFNSTYLPTYLPNYLPSVNVNHSSIPFLPISTYMYELLLYVTIMMSCI